MRPNVANRRRRANDARYEIGAASRRSVHLHCWAFGSSALCVNGRRDGLALAVWTSRPTARPAHASTHLIYADFDAVLPSLFFLRRRDPTDPLVSGQWGDVGPEALGSGVGFDGSPKICR